MQPASKQKPQTSSHRNGNSKNRLPFVEKMSACVPKIHHQ
jgi:hypothetical protein